MSDVAYWAARQQPSRPLDKLVLLAFADRADKASGECFPSVAWLVEWTGCDRKTIMKSTASLEAAGLLIDTGARRGKTKQVKVYRLPFETVPVVAPLPGETVPETAPFKPPAKSPVFPTKGSQKRDTDPLTEPPSQKTSSSSKKRAGRRTPMPAIFVPVMTAETASVVDGWPPGRFAEQIEACRDWHLREGKMSADWQASWRTWVRNSKRWDTINEQSRSARRSQADRGSPKAAVLAAFDCVDFS